MADKSRSEKKSSNPAAEEAAEKHIFAASGVKTPHSFEGGYRSAGSAAPPKVGVFPQPVEAVPFHDSTEFHELRDATLTPEGSCARNRTSSRVTQTPDLT